MASPGRPQDVWKSSSAERPPGAPRSPVRGRRRWFVAALLVVALGGALAGLLFYLWPDPPPVILAIPVTAYEQPDWTPNAWAEADARAFLSCTPDGGTHSFQAQEKQSILRELNRAADDSGKRPLVVSITALGVASSGKVHLIPSGGRADDLTTWLALEDVLSPLRRAKAPRMLVLDLRPVVSPRAVLTGVDVNEILDSTLTKLADSGDLPFLVLTANTPVDGANLFRPLQGTAFGLALAQGAGGAADGWNAERKRDGRVSARELAAYTRELTHHASTTGGFPDQVPRLHGPAGDFDLVRVPRDGPRPLPSLVDPEPYPDWLQAAWKDRLAWFADGTYSRAPRLSHHLTLAASRAESRRLNGGNLDAIKSAFEAVLPRLREIRATLPSTEQPVGSVARAERRSRANTAGVAEALRPLFNRLLESPGPERDKGLAEAMKTIWDKPPEGEPFDSVALAVFLFVRNLEKPTHDQMKHLARFIAGLKPQPPRHAELVTLALIGTQPAERVERWPEGTIGLLLELAREAEEAAAIDGRCLPWVGDSLAMADEKRRKAIRDICDPASTNAVRREAVAAIESAVRDYRSVQAAARALGHAILVQEETRTVLVDLAVAFPFDALPLPDLLAAAWDALADDLGKLQQALRAPTAPILPDAAELGRLAGSVIAGRHRLVSALRIPDVSAPVRQFEATLRWPHWSPDERHTLLARMDRAERAAARKVLDGWLKEPPIRETVAPPPAGARVAARALGELRRTLAILRLVDGPDAADLKAEFDRLGPSPTPAAIEALAGRVRIASRRRLAEMYVAAEPGRQAAIGWAVDPDDVPAFPQPGRAGPPNPEPAERRNAEKAFHEWLAARRYGVDWATLDMLDAVQGYREVARMYNEAFR